MARKAEVSAGILVYRETNGTLEVLLAHPGGPLWARKDEGAWTIPKGLVEPGADLLATAQREFTEETGFVADGPFVPLAAVRQTSGKIVHAFACRGDFDAAKLISNTFEIEWPPRSGSRREFPEVDRAEWFAPATARRKVLVAQAAFVDRLLDRLESRTG